MCHEGSVAKCPFKGEKMKNKFWSKFWEKWFRIGSERYVILLPGYVVKITFRPYMVFRAFVNDPFLSMFMRKQDRTMGGVRRALFTIRNNYVWLQQRNQKARMANECEIKLAKTALREFLPQIIFALGNQVIIARRCSQNKDRVISHDSINKAWLKIYDLYKQVGGEFSGALAHTFNEENFGFGGEKILLLDSGSEELLRMMEQNPDAVVQIFRDMQMGME